ncbi:VWA domain-containing protein [Leadbettera azotonutricia]|uniref:Putative arginine biosynthesis protein ArgJ n=1 Tax=Leadbettera azotonutricia (strain ATCC BAA-888 / DSM 13862 / ZAS-9) TaxID=545695 RepID=F5YGH2_LEAAZ|nr:VWA domain-containing protein [Leadbettera azotonutricia]AEF83010.1 putative arginine biosynthesis protein ArgJ [Leadbettera azotonutricia ZAS-9]
MRTNTPKVLLVAFLVFSFPYFLVSEGLTDAAPLYTRNRYRANNGIIVPPEEINDGSYISLFNYQYPEPDTDIGLFLYNNLNPEDNNSPGSGRDGLLQIGLQGKSLSFQEIPSLNLVFVVDTSVSMNEGEKIGWVKESLGSFANKVRNMDSLALIGFNDAAQVYFEPARIDSSAKRAAFINAVNSLSPKGGTKLEDGINLGYEQVLKNRGANAINMVLVISDGDEFSSRLAGALAHTGDIRISLMWNNRNDLDLHVITPANEEIFFNRMRDSTGGWLDVDRNVNGETLDPVENIFWYRGEAAHGTYQVWVQNFDYHSSEYETPFQIELKNGNEYRYYEGTVSETGSNSNTLVCTFDFNDSTTISPAYQIVETYTGDGVSISTIGIGGNFDEDLLRTLAQNGRGNTRSLDTRESMNAILNTDREFERFAVPAIRDMGLSLEFSPDVEILGVWGSQYKSEGSTISCVIPSLNQGDYKTLLVHYRIPGGNQRQQTALLRGRTLDESGLTPFPERTIVLADPSNADALQMLTYSQAIASFALSIKEIGRIFYADNNPDRLRTSLRLTGEAELALQTAKRTLGEGSFFASEFALLSKYTELLNREMRGGGAGAVERTSAMSIEGGRYSIMNFGQ